MPERDNKQKNRIQDITELEPDMQRFLDYCSTERQLNPRSVKAYRGDLSKLSRWKAEQRPGRTTAKTVEAYLTHLIQNADGGQQTVYRKARVLRVYLDYLTKNGSLTPEDSKLHIPDLRSLKGPRVNTPLGRADVSRLFETIRNEGAEGESCFKEALRVRDSAMFKLMYYNALDMTEVAGARLADLDLAHGKLAIRERDGTIKHAELFARDLRNELEEWTGLRARLLRNEAQHSVKSKQVSDSAYLFLSKLGKPLSMQMITKNFVKWRDLAGIDESVTAQALKISMEEYGKRLAREACGREERFWFIEAWGT